jgi:hypothetical protein
MPSKFGKHNTIDRDAMRFVRRAEANRDLKRVALGQVEPCRHSKTVGTAKLKRILPGTLHVQVFLGGGILNLYLYLKKGSEVAEVQRTLGL